MARKKKPVLMTQCAECDNLTVDATDGMTQCIECLRSRAVSFSTTAADEWIDELPAWAREHVDRDRLVDDIDNAFEHAMGEITDHARSTGRMPPMDEV